MSSSLPATESARELAEKLVPLLETVANLHYLLDLNVAEPERLKALRATEDDAFSHMLDLVLGHLPELCHPTRIKA